MWYEKFRIFPKEKNLINCSFSFYVFNSFVRKCIQLCIFIQMIVFRTHMAVECCVALRSSFIRRKNPYRCRLRYKLEPVWSSYWVFARKLEKEDVKNQQKTFILHFPRYFVSYNTKELWYIFCKHIFLHLYKRFNHGKAHFSL